MVPSSQISTKLHRFLGSKSSGTVPYFSQCVTCFSQQLQKHMDLSKSSLSICRVPFQQCVANVSKTFSKGLYRRILFSYQPRITSDFLGRGVQNVGAVHSRLTRGRAGLMRNRDHTDFKQEYIILNMEERRRKMEELRNSNMQIRKLLTEGSLKDIGQITTQIKRTLENQSAEIPFVKTINANTSGIFYAEQSKAEPIQQRKYPVPMLQRIASSPDQHKPKQRKKSMFQSRSFQSELVELRQLKLRLQSQVKDLSASIQQLQQQNNLLKIGPPYVQISQKMNVFCTRIFVRPEDYDKIDYDRFTVTLKPQKVEVLRDAEEGPWRSLLLENIREVRYSSKQMILEFKDGQAESDYVFFGFEDDKQMKNWDFGMYINRVIDKCIHKDKLFWMEFTMIAQNSPMMRSARKMSMQGGVMNMGNPPSSLKRKTSFNLDPTKKLIQTPTIVEEENKYEDLPEPSVSIFRDASSKEHSKDNINNSQTNSNNPKRKPTDQRTQQGNYPKAMPRSEDPNLQSSPPPMILQSLTPESEVDVDHKYELQKARLDQIERQFQERHHKKEQEKGKLHLQPPQIEQKHQKKPTVSKKNEQYNENKLNLIPVSQPPVIAPELNQSTASANGSEYRLRMLTDDLRKAKRFRKYAKGGLKPRDKEVYLADNEEELCWKDVESKRISKIKIDDITEILDGQLGEGMKKFQDKNKKLDRNCCVLIKTKDKIIELYNEDSDLVKKFARDLYAFRNIEKSID